MDELPTVQDELTRKAFETLERLILHLEQGRITDAQFNTGVEVLWDTTSGLVHRPFFEAISEVKGAVQTKFVERRIFGKGRTAIVVERSLADPKVVVKEIAGVERFRVVKRKDFSDEPVPSKSALEAVQRYVAKLLNMGFKEV